MSNNDEIINTIENDKLKNPNCSYSYQSSKKCSSSSDNDNLLCNITKQVYRHCPSEQPKKIYTINEQESIPNDQNSSNSSFFNKKNLSNSLIDNIDGIFDNNQEDINAINSWLKRSLDDFPKLKNKNIYNPKNIDRNAINNKKEDFIDSLFGNDDDDDDD